MKTDTLYTFNQKTGEKETIKQYDIEIHDLGMSFNVMTEAEAYKTAYAYRKCTHGLIIEYNANIDMWRITVFNAEGEKINNCK